MTGTPHVYVQPGCATEISQAVTSAGARLVDNPSDASVVVWGNIDATGFTEAKHDHVEWVQLPFAGIDRWLADGLLDRERVFTAAAGAYAAPVAEHALALILAGVRRLHECARATDWGARWERAGRSLTGMEVTIVGCGGIGERLLDVLRSLGSDVTAVTRSGRQVPGAVRSVAARDLGSVWSESDVVVLLAPATDETTHLVGAPELRAMRDDAWLVNVARGSLVDTDALLAALDTEQIGGAALDVTDPEPLPAGHPLWHHPRALVSPHVACPPQVLTHCYARRVEENLQRYRAGRPLLGVVDLDRGY